VSDIPEEWTADDTAYRLKGNDRLYTGVRVREVEIEFSEWLHPQMGVVPVDPKTPLILKAKIREEM
jgi:hypothetical protein